MATVYSECCAVDILIVSVDYAPDDLDEQTPVRGQLLRKIAGQDRRRCDYWLAELKAPVSWTKDGVTRTIRHLVLWARWEGTSICPRATLPVGIAYVIDDSLLESKSFEFAKAEYVAMGLAKVSGTSLWSRFAMLLLGSKWLHYRWLRNLLLLTLP
jgi:hypothetical protein